LHITKFSQKCSQNPMLTGILACFINKMTIFSTLLRFFQSESFDGIDIPIYLF